MESMKAFAKFYNESVKPFVELRCNAKGMQMKLDAISQDLSEEAGKKTGAAYKYREFLL